MVDKLIKDGKVAVLISPGYGAGWSTWNDSGDRRQNMVFDAEIARLVIGFATPEEIKALATRKYPDACLLGIEDLDVIWVPVGTQFMVTEYDGSEEIQLILPTTGYIA